VFGKGHVIKLLRVSSITCSVGLVEPGIAEEQISVVTGEIQHVTGQIYFFTSTFCFERNIV
jgi:hypothetical protein